MSANKRITLHMDNERKQGEGQGQPKGAGDTSQHDAIPQRALTHNNAQGTEPDERDICAARAWLLDGKSAVEALRSAGFPDSTAKHGSHEFKRSKSLRVACMQVLENEKVPIPPAEVRANIVRRQLLVNCLTDSGAGGSNMAAKLLGSDREVNMFVSDVQQGNINLIAPQGQFNFNATGASTPVHDENQRKQLMSEDIPDDIAG